MKITQTLRPLHGAWCVLTLIVFMLGWMSSASAFTTLDRDACWSAWTNAFIYSNGDGRLYIRPQEGVGSPLAGWSGAELIELVEDATNVPGQAALVNGLCAGFTNVAGMDWSGDSWNDDLMWQSMAFSRAYQLTGNTMWRTLAKNGFDVAYGRGWDPTDGGIFQTTDDPTNKCTCGNGNATCAAYLLYQTLGDSSYLTKAQGIFGYMLTNVFNPTNGAVQAAKYSPGVYFSYDFGTFATAALWLGYTNYAYKAFDFVTNQWGVQMEGFGPGSDASGFNGICVRGLARTGRNIPFLQAVSDNAWSWRNSRGLSDCTWRYRTGETNQGSWNTGNTVVALLCVPPGVPPTLPVIANDVVGSQVIFTAAFPSGMTYQWQKIGGGVTNNISGATNMTLTLSNLQLTDTASYQLQASNASRIQISIPSSLTVSNAPASVNNVIASYADQTGQGYGCPFTPTWTLQSGSIIQGRSPSSTNGNFNLESDYGYGNRNVNFLTADGCLTIAPEVSTTNFETYTATFTATAATHTLSFVGTDLAGGDNTIFIDNVQIVSSGGVSVPVSDSGFESPVLGSGNYQYNPGGSPWTFSGSSPNGSGIVANGSAFGNPNAPEGVQAAFIQEDGTMSQAISGLVPGTTYTITFSAAQRPGNVQSWNVAIGFATPPSSSYTNFAVSFTATASSETLAYVGTDLRGGDNTLFIDNVQIVSSGGTSVTVPNFGFESPGLGIGSYQYNPSGGSWTFGGSSPNGSGIVANGSAFGNPNAPQGTQAGFIQSYGTISQTISGLTPGTTYTNTFYASERPGNNQTWNVTMNGKVIGSTATVIGSYGVDLVTSTNYVTCGSGAGSNLVYTLPASAQGYYLTNVTVYGGWAGSDRDAQAYTVYYSTVSAPSTFLLLGSVNFNSINTGYNPLYGTGCVPVATRTTLTPVTAALATNVAAIMFDFTSPVAAGDFDGYAQIQLFGVPIVPIVTANTLPITAADVVGSQVTFTAGISGLAPITYQWQKISGGVTNNIAGAINTTLTLSNLQLTDTASYQLVASNANGVAVSSPGALTVSSVPAAVNNVVTAMAAQTGSSSGSSFTPTWTLAANSLIAGQLPSSTIGNFNLEPYWGSRNVNSLTAGGSLTIATGGSPTTTSTNYVSCGTVASTAGRLVTYTLSGPANGFNLTNIMVYGGWRDAGRDQQGYTVYYSTVAAPSTFVSLGSVSYNPTNTAGVACATRATLTAANGWLATNVAAVKFDFTTPTTPNGWCGYAQLQVFGTPTFVTATNPTNITLQVSGNNLTLNWPADHLGWRLQMQTNDMTQGLGTNWVDVPGSTMTNQFVIPINPANGSVFYRMIYP